MKGNERKNEEIKHRKNIYTNKRIEVVSETTCESSFLSNASIHTFKEANIMTYQAHSRSQ
jgi:hypothetical protein